MRYKRQSNHRRWPPLWRRAHFASHKIMAAFGHGFFRRRLFLKERLILKERLNRAAALHYAHEHQEHQKPYQKRA
jgi:hypothetical protein